MTAWPSINWVIEKGHIISKAKKSIEKCIVNKHCSNSDGKTIVYTITVVQQKSNVHLTCYSGSINTTLQMKTEQSFSEKHHGYYY